MKNENERNLEVIQLAKSTSYKVVETYLHVEKKASLAERAQAQRYSHKCSCSHWCLGII
jgi:hypothetical protein